MCLLIWSYASHKITLHLFFGMASPFSFFFSFFKEKHMCPLCPCQWPLLIFTKNILKRNLDKKKKIKISYGLENLFVTIFFYYKYRNHPFWYIKNDQFKNIVKKKCYNIFFLHVEVIEKKISFTDPPSLSTFWKNVSVHNRKLSYDKLYNHCNYNNKKKNT
jgi:hypothetical protein